MIGLVVVSHSRALADAAVALAREMVHGSELRIEIAAGLDDHTFGTDATAIAEAIDAADSGDGVVVLMDLGSALLSADLALELVDHRDRVTLSSASLVEGLVAAAVTASGGADRETVAAEADAALGTKQNQLRPAEQPAPDSVTSEFTVTDEHGLHARPAARLVQALRNLETEVFVRNKTSGSSWVKGDSLAAVASIGALAGHVVEVAASVRASHPQQDEIHARGASPGTGVGPAVVRQALAPDEPLDPIAAIAKVRDKIRAVRERTARELGAEEAEIFDAHLLLLDDVRTRITDGRSWSEAFDELHKQFADLPDRYLRARAADVVALRDLASHRGDFVPDGVLVADDLTPAQAAALDADRTVAVLLTAGSPTSHSSILLRAKGIPAVVGVGPLDVPAGTIIAVNGTDGTFEVDPEPEIQRRYQQRPAAPPADHEPAVTADGTTIVVSANVGSLQEAKAAVEFGADSAGLVRTEFLFLDRQQPPAVDEQEASYRAIAEAFGGRRITLRTLDIGGDKPVDYLPTLTGANPFLGVRGIRLSMRHEDLFADQLRAIVATAQDHPVSIMFPMVATRDELTWATGVLDEIGRPERLRVGIMVEIPAAALNAESFAPYVDFFSVGTNDLTQYTLAAERGNPDVEVDPHDRAILQLVAAVTKTGKPTAVCGELAADEQATAALLGLGVRELSVAPRSVAAIKQAVRRTTG